MPPVLEPTTLTLLDFVYQVLSAFLGAGFAFGFALWLAHKEKVDTLTYSMIEQFSSQDMLTSRYVVANLSRRVKDGDLSLRKIAQSSLMGAPKGFVGRKIGGLTEHQHLSKLIGWIRRLAVLMSNNSVNKKTIAITLGGSLQWSLPFLLSMTDEVERLAEEFHHDAPLSARAAWIYYVRYVDVELKRAKFHKLVLKRPFTL